MKLLLTGASAILLFTGCAAWDYQGRPGHDSGRETEHDRRLENRAGDNLMDVSRQTSPTTPWAGWGNGSRNF